MSLFEDMINYEVCFPGAVTGATEVRCPHCGELLTVPVNDPMGQESYQCCQCGGDFDVDWGAGKISWYKQESE
jgi:DNA-directed RNA polymerase subunit RPC12/RpoP